MLNKDVKDLQENVAIDSEGNVTGTLKYVDSYPNFSSVESEQKGNYLAIKFEEATQGKTVKVKLTKESTLDSDGQLVLLVTDTSKNKPLVVTVDNEESYQLNLSKLTLSPAPIVYSSRKTKIKSFNE
ncbi:hypothetical protein [uncultured Rikenella sp.]|uniref:hypothetical protein n=1 Tax=uncultured Rikenella sp. TaxID=368003 RepID=UPI00260E6AD4|nr:hypothetical protein [uncultured Rikenella sp.]